MPTAFYHLPGLFEFYELYRVFLPLFRTHREYFYDWCGIGSIYGAPGDCLWGGGRVGFGEADARAVLALVQEYGISARLTFSNSLLREDARFDFGRMGGIMLFRRRLTECEPRQVTRAEFACWLLGEQESMDIDDMLECARQDFGYEIDKYDLKAACEQSGLYWDTIMNRVYRNYDIYYDEV